MTQNLSRNPQHQASANRRTQRHPQAQLRTDSNPDAILREIAFVLKLTERVRGDIEAEQEVNKPMMA